MRKWNIVNSKPIHPTDPAEASWSTLIPDDQWEVFVEGTDAIRPAGIPLLLGGAMALAAYTGHWRNTKDIDVIIHPAGREAAVGALRARGFDDYGDTEPYDRSWIFRGIRNGVIFDIIWALPNHRVPIDDGWFQRAPPLQLRRTIHAAVPAEELIRMKLYVMQRERCDWVDVFNLLGSASAQLDWSWLLRRMGRDLPLLQAAVAVFTWMCPTRAHSVPAWVREQFALQPSDGSDPEASEKHRVRLFDSRPWFAPHLPVDQPLER